MTRLAIGAFVCEAIALSVNALHPPEAAADFADSCQAGSQCYYNNHDVPYPQSRSLSALH